MTDTAAPINFETTPDRYRHWRLEIDGETARLVWDVRENEPLRPGYVLKLNTYDLGVDIELADAVQRLRFEHPEVKAVVITSGKDRMFSAGANIHMLGSSSHAFKVNFCKFTNETRLAIEDAGANSGQRYVAACNGVTAGGGYELALACDRILLVDDGSSAVSLPEVPLLGVLPGTGGLTRVVDKRQVRRDRADVFCTVAEGVKGPRAKAWNLVDDIAPRSRFDELVGKTLRELASTTPERPGPGVELTPLEPEVEADRITYRHLGVTVDHDGRTATLLVRGPEEDAPTSPEAMRTRGADLWHLRLFRELDDAICRLRFNEEDIGLWLLKTEGEPRRVLEHDAALARNADRDWFAREVVLLVARTLRRLECTARSLFALVEPGSCFAGSLLELPLAADRTYALDDPDEPPTLAVGELNLGALPMAHGLGRLRLRHLHSPQEYDRLAASVAAGEEVRLEPSAAEKAGIVTIAADDIDYEDEVRVAIEERASISPDALTGMEASLRFPANETMQTKIFGRLSAWQNWIFQRPNAVGETGALTLYGEPTRPTFDWRRT
ncbi:MAG: 2,3-epoxybenzoyl-CoA dihydrolase [Acidobacteriota bacterium]|jgi:benzoyl-CoA-dihydrodiol lyase